MISVSSENIKINIGKEKKMDVKSNIPRYEPRLLFYSKNHKVSISENGIVKRNGVGEDIVIVMDSRTKFFRAITIS